MSFSLEKNLEADYKILLSWRYDKVEFLGLPSLKENRPLTLEEIYVPLSFTWEISDTENRFYLPKAMTESRHLVVLGDPGSGKSMLVKLITHSFGRREPTSLSKRFGPLLPVPIILRDYDVRKWKTYRDMLSDFIAQLDEKVRDDVTIEWLLCYLCNEREDKKAILLLDGLDEVGSKADREHLRDKIVRPLLEKMSESYAVLTSRIVGYEEVPFDLEPEIVRKNARIIQRNRQSKFYKKVPLSLFLPRRIYVTPFNGEEIEQFIARWYASRDEDPERRREGVESLKQALGQNDRVKLLASNPSLLTLIALVYRVTAQLPSGRVKLYDKIVEAYLETIDRYRKLNQYPASLEQMKRWLARVGWEMQSRRDNQKKESELFASKHEIFDWLKEAIAADGRATPEEEAEQFLNWVERRTGLLIDRGLEQFSFVHLTFQEYFAAFHLRGQVRRFDHLSKKCAELVINAHWHETLCVLFEMLAEFPGAGDDLIDELISSAEMTEKDSTIQRKTAELLSSLLLDDENGLSRSKREEAAAFALNLVTGDYNSVVVDNLDKSVPDWLGKYIGQWFDQQLKERKPDECDRDFFLTGDRLIPNWPERIGGWIKNKGSEEFNRIQVVAITLIGVGSQEVCNWSLSHLPLTTWLRPLMDMFFDNVPIGESLADLYRKPFYELSLQHAASPRQRLLMQASVASAIVKAKLFRAVILLKGSNSNLARSVADGLTWLRYGDSAHNQSQLTLQDIRAPIGKAMARAWAYNPMPSIARAMMYDIFLLLAQDTRPEMKSVMASILDAILAIFFSKKTDTTTSLLEQTSPQTDNWLTTILQTAEQIFSPTADSAESVNLELKELIKAKDDWTRLVAISALLMLGDGTPELCDERNALLDKGIRQGSKFTFPIDLNPETKNAEFRKQLPELLDLIFAHKSGEPWLKRNLFDPAYPESKYFLSKPRELFILAADTLDPEGESELSEWRKRLASG
jgi:hypothetical protein